MGSSLPSVGLERQSWEGPHLSFYGKLPLVKVTQGSVAEAPGIDHSVLTPSSVLKCYHSEINF